MQPINDSPLVLVNLVNALSSGPQIKEMSPEFIHAILNLYLKAVARQAPPSTVVSAEEPESEFSQMVFLDPDQVEQEMIEEGNIPIEKADQGKGTSTWLKTSFVFIRIALGNTSENLPSKGPSISQSDNPKEIKKGESSQKDVSFSFVKTAFEKLAQEKPELAPQILEITNWFETQMKEGFSKAEKQEVSNPKLIVEEVKTSLQEMKKEELVSLSKALFSEHPVLALKIFQESTKQMSREELLKQFDALKEEHPYLAIECAKRLTEGGNALLKSLIDSLLKPPIDPFSKQLDQAFTAAKALQGSDRQEELKKLTSFLKEEHPSLALEAAKALIGRDSTKALFDLTLFFSKTNPELALKSAEEIRGKDRFEHIAQLVKILCKENPQLALQMAQSVLPQIRMLPDPQRTQLLILFTPPLDIKEIKGAINNPFAQSFSFRASGISSSKSRKKNSEEEEEEQKGSALFTFYTKGPFDSDFIEKVQKALLLEGILVKQEEMKDYDLLLQKLVDEKMGSLFFQQKHLVKEPFAPLVSFYLEPFGLYSEKVVSLSDLSEKDLIAIPKEPLEQERALLFLETLGLKQCSVLEVESPYLMSCLDSASAVVLPSLEAWRFGMLSKALALEAKDSPYTTVLAVPFKDLKDKDFLFLKKCLESDEIRFYMETAYRGVLIPAF